ncbi:MAG: metal ABC transporter permease [Candidatus Bathyarchaeota archaeon]|uniref:metal ABC transporter permease n=3 Tax=Candidatus Bathycorpusculum sp. TaxID=2994959 RepID=UPI0028248ED2|nr:metal ABC transporter permease [Candidatus Termiticorpusculum sp.]MCL2292531.1 metal ABC transporter permease [Candidatus Termiticorpusculum sp.]
MNINFFNLFSYNFFQNALIGGIIVAIVCGLMGLFLILKKEAMIGDGLSHTAFGGIAIGLLMGINPIITALATSILAVFTISYMRRKKIATSDSAVAIMLAIGFSTGLIIISIAGGFNIELFNYLFGSILTITLSDLLLVSALSTFVLLFIGFFRRELLSMIFDEEDSKLRGIPTNYLTIIFDILTAITIVLSIKIIGTILVIAILVIPGLCALKLNLSFKKTLLTTTLFSTISTTTGIIISAIFNIATAGIIVLVLVTFFIITLIYKKLE